MPSPKIILGFIAAVFVLNVLFLDYLFVSQRSELIDFRTRLVQLTDSFKILGGRLYSAGDEVPPTVNNILNPVNTAVCPTSCVDLILLSTQSGKVPTSSLINPVYQPVTTTVTSKGEYFVPLGTGSITSTGAWVDVNTAQATIDTGAYSSVTAIYFEVVMHVSAGEVRARLYDTTTPFIYEGEQVQTTSSTGQLLSAKVPLRSGSKTYKVQMYSTISQGFLDQARIRIVTQ